MKTISCLLLAASLSACGTASSPSSQAAPPAPDAAARSGALVASAQVRRQSRADDVLFRDLLRRPGGVGFADKVFFANATTRTLLRIEVVRPYDGRSIGEERWVVGHDDGGETTYVVSLIPSPRGGTDFTVAR
jgi:hypothetical protein